MDEIDLIRLLPEIIDHSRIMAEEIIKERSIDFYREKKGYPNQENANLLYKSDNIHAMKDLIDKGYTSNIDLIYIDPPFYTEKD